MLVITITAYIEYAGDIRPVDVVVILDLLGFELLHIARVRKTKTHAPLREGLLMWLLELGCQLLSVIGTLIFIFYLFLLFLFLVLIPP